MEFLEEAYDKYLQSLREHLFEDKPLKQLLENVPTSHRERRFIGLYMMKDRETFYAFYENRIELGVERICNQVLAALFDCQDQLPVKRKMVNRLGVSSDWITHPVSDYEIKEATKDLYAFVWRAVKQVLVQPV